MKKICYFFYSLFFLPVFAQAQADSLRTDSTELPNVVISASRQQETILQTPVSIEKLRTEEIRQSAQFSFFDAIQNVKGIQMITPSLGFKVINARGFANTTNVRFVQLVDGMDIQAPHIGAPIANALGPSDLDIQSVEIIPGASSALYGMNAINGTADFITKDPFIHTGLSVQQKTGVNHIGEGQRTKPFSETALRWAKRINEKWAFKLNAVYTKGTDWYADNRTDLNSTANSSTNLTGTENPGKDLVNIYGDESSNRKTLLLGGKQYVVSRTGYAERDMSSYDLQNIKGDLGLWYKFKKDVLLGYTFRIAHTNTIYQRTNRFRLDDYFTQQHSIFFKTKDLQLRAYVNTENTGNSYNIRSMAENIDRSFKTDDVWFPDFSNRFNAETSNGSSVADAMAAARKFADAARPQPHTPHTDSLVAQLRNINDWNRGAALQVRTAMYHAEMQQDLTENILQGLRKRFGLSLMYGLDYRMYVVIPDGNYFINPTKQGADLRYWKTGGFVQATKFLLSEKLKLNMVLRVDKNQYFSAKLNPRLAAVYAPKKKYSFRLSYQEGYRFPSLFEAFSNINSGGVKRVGGLPVMSHGIFENSYLRASIDAFAAANTADVNRNGLTLSQAIEKNKALLKHNTYTYLQPEKVKSLEAGFRASLFEEKLSVDLDFYYNSYRNLMAQVEANIPKTTLPDSIAYYLNDRSKQDRYRLWTNSKTVSYNYGSTLGLAWNLPRNFKLTGNVTFSALDRRDQKDGLEDGFNTPRWIYNIGFGNAALGRHFGFGVNYRWQSSFLWQSSLATGTVPAYATLDAQVQYGDVQNKFSIKLGATNLANKYYYSFIGGPAVGGFYYSTVTVQL